MTGKIKISYMVLHANGRQTPGSFETSKLDSNETMEAVRAICREHIGGDREHVRVYWDDKYTSMFVDETGRLKNLPLNSKATDVYRNNVKVHDPKAYSPASMPWIAGPAILFDRDVWF